MKFIGAFIAVCIYTLILAFPTFGPQSPEQMVNLEPLGNPMASFASDANASTDELLAHLAAVEAERIEAERIAAEEEAARIAAEEAAYLEAMAVSTGYSVSYLQGCTPEQRRAIESGGDYGANTGNGYLGAYQFSAQYNAGRWEACFGTPYPGDAAFLADQTAQDQLADWYANQRYGGWQNVPSSGGW